MLLFFSPVDQYKFCEAVSIFDNGLSVYYNEGTYHSAVRVACGCNYLDNNEVLWHRGI